MIGKRLIIVVFVVLSGSALHGSNSVTDIESDLDLLAALHQVRAMWIDPAVADWEINRWIDDQVDAWRGPRPDGSYEWVLRERPDSEVVDRSEQLIYGTPDQLARIEDGDSWVYGVKLVVPRKRSLFRGNHPVLVDSITTRSQSEDGQVIEDTLEVERWFAPNTSQTWDFETIVARADVVVEAAAEPDHRGESLLEIHFLESVERDDPDGPHFHAIRMLGYLRDLLSAERIDRAIEETEKRLIPAAHSVPVSMVAELLERAVETLGSDDPEEREKGLAAVEQALELLRTE